MGNSVGTPLKGDTNNTLLRIRSPAWAPVQINWLEFRKAVDKINKLKEESNANRSN